MKFTKMQGLGNDYVYVDVRAQPVPLTAQGGEGADSVAPKSSADPAALARAVSDRHTGIGADGLILIHPSERADVRMEMYNADGSRAQMCGNGIRCVAKYAVEHGLAVGPELLIETDAGLRSAWCDIESGWVHRVRVDMGEPSLDPVSLPSTLRLARIVEHPLAVGENEYKVTCVSIGNPHAVVFVDDLKHVRLEQEGPLLEEAAPFPERINVHFVRVDTATCATVQTWERGAGATRACGTGACAVCVAGVVTGRTDRTIVARLPGGELEVEWAPDGHVYMTGPAVEVFTGEWHKPR